MKKRKKIYIVVMNTFNQKRKKKKPIPFSPKHYWKKQDVFTTQSKKTTCPFQALWILESLSERSHINIQVETYITWKHLLAECTYTVAVRDHTRALLVLLSQPQLISCSVLVQPKGSEVGGCCGCAAFWLLIFWRFWWW